MDEKNINLGTITDRVGYESIDDLVFKIDIENDGIYNAKVTLSGRVRRPKIIEFELLIAVFEKDKKILFNLRTINNDSVSSGTLAAIRGNLRDKLNEIFGKEYGVLN